MMSYLILGIFILLVFAFYLKDWASGVVAFILGGFVSVFIILTISLLRSIMKYLLTS